MRKIIKITKKLKKYNNLLQSFFVETKTKRD